MRTTDQLLRWLGGYSSSVSPKLPPSGNSPTVLPKPQALRALLLPRHEGKSLTAKIVEAVRTTAAHRIADVARIADVEREIAGLEQQRATSLLADDPANFSSSSASSGS